MASNLSQHPLVAKAEDVADEVISYSSYVIVDCMYSWALR